MSLREHFSLISTNSFRLWFRYVYKLWIWFWWELIDISATGFKLSTYSRRWQNTPPNHFTELRLCIRTRMRKQILVCTFSLMHVYLHQVRIVATWRLKFAITIPQGKRTLFLINISLETIFNNYENEMISISQMTFFSRKFFVFIIF